ncbi:MAG: signal peptidase II [Steroidobacteraceae bacterium]|jgi:signal peptidase II
MSSGTGVNTRELGGRIWLLLSLAVIALDQWSKAWIVRHMAFHVAHPLLPVLDLTLAYNTGAAFSFLATQSGWQRWLLTGLALAVAVLIVFYLGRLKARRQGLLCAALALILGGAVGNVIDRIRLGYVVDFISFHWRGHYFPAFNVADSSITIGAGLLLLDLWREGRGSRPPRSAQEDN